MSSRIGAAAIVLLLSWLMVHCGGGNVNLSRSIPMSIAGWQAGEEDETYDRDTLYGYMNGGAEVFLAFDQGSEYGFGLLRFWQNRFFVTIMTNGDDEATDAAILELGRAVADQLGPDGELPSMLSLLPIDGLIDDRTSYFHSNINLNNRYFIASENILGLGDDTRCLFAEYRGDGSESVRLLVVGYPDSARADTAFDSFIQGYMPEAGESGLAQMEDDGWSVAGVHDEYLSIIFDAPTEDDARQIASAIDFDTVRDSE